MYVGAHATTLLEAWRRTPPPVSPRSDSALTTLSTYNMVLVQAQAQSIRGVPRDDPRQRRLTLPKAKAGAGGRPTMREVAALAGVSLKTVSPVINTEPAVSADRRARVLGGIERLDYRHNHAASSLRRSDRKSSTIGVLLQDVANPFSSALPREIEDHALDPGVVGLAVNSRPQRCR